MRGICVTWVTQAPSGHPRVLCARDEAAARRTLAERGLFGRSRAAAAVMAGDVRVAGAAARKPGELVADDAELTVTDAPPFVSRAGIKLANALDALGLDPAGCRALDVGVDRRSSPTACSSAAPITWWQSTWPTGELHWRLRNDPRVTVVERRNARALRPGESCPTRPTW